jgi:hypothetical protein
MSDGRLSASQMPSGSISISGAAASTNARQRVVDDLGRRVDDVEQVAERPDRGLDERHATSRGGLDEPVEATGAAHLT